MLKVGEFSRLSQVTVKTLHHYDEIGLLKPAHIDPFTAYRYYSVDQLPRLHRIMALKELGLSLEQVKDILDEALSPDEIRGMLRLQRAEVQQHLRAEHPPLVHRGPEAGEHLAHVFRLARLAGSGFGRSADARGQRADRRAAG